MSQPNFRPFRRTESPRVGGAGEDDGDSRPHIMILISALFWNNIMYVSIFALLNNRISQQ